MLCEQNICAPKWKESSDQLQENLYSFESFPTGHSLPHVLLFHPEEHSFVCKSHQINEKGKSIVDQQLVSILNHQHSESSSKDFTSHLSLFAWYRPSLKISVLHHSLENIHEYRSCMILKDAIKCSIRPLCCCCTPPLHPSHHLILFHSAPPFRYTNLWAYDSGSWLSWAQFKVQFTWTWQRRCNAQLMLATTFCCIFVLEKSTHPYDYDNDGRDFSFLLMNLKRTWTI